MRRVGAAIALAVVAVLAAAAPAWAHSYLVDSNPEVGGIVTELPEQFWVEANEPLLDLDGEGSGFGIEVIDSEGRYYGDGCVRVEGPTVSTTAALGAPGRYLLVYQFISADGHAVSDRFSFDWEPVGDFEVSAGTATPGDCNGLYARGDGGPDGEEAASVDASALLWLGGAVLAAGAAVGVTLLVARRRA